MPATIGIPIPSRREEEQAGQSEVQDAGNVNVLRSDLLTLQSACNPHTRSE